ncbi:hypothetical protein CHLRE_02g141346v5 [Chlamydomonas reinhardtii]|uniref:Uncharacterized protein n=1 Tax=Chlamydomonas reinhardtii TaxID=3055 RepID=A0A2K3E4E2_CHLRE|nr:uncharacterized protein CHLRE_02g141346v5 [Chlamydomonas reinhardtii]PNW87597.1 hypothetical protein CHLRE_02g141346v5 [Chlamydomonas reinhardtii]
MGLQLRKCPLVLQGYTVLAVNTRFCGRIILKRFCQDRAFLMRKVLSLKAVRCTYLKDLLRDGRMNHGLVVLQISVTF